MDKATWLEARRSGIGGSDAASVMGLSKWGTPLGVYLAKRGESSPIEENEAMRWGTILEPVIRQQYADYTGLTVVVPNEILRNPKYPFMLANLDGRTDCPRVVEIKTARSGSEWGEPGTDEIPVDYLCQVQHYMIVTEYEQADVAVLIGGSDFRIYTVPADPELQAMMIEREAKFWEMVQAGIPPEPINLNDAIRLYRSSVPHNVQATSDLMEAVLSLKRVKQNIDAYEHDAEELKAKIMLAMGESDTLVDLAGRPLCTWKSAKGRETFDAKTFKADHPNLHAQYTKTGESSRRFLIKD